MLHPALALTSSSELSIAEYASQVTSTVELSTITTYSHIVVPSGMSVAATSCNLGAQNSIDFLQSKFSTHSFDVVQVLTKILTPAKCQICVVQWLTTQL